MAMSGALKSPPCSTCGQRCSSQLEHIDSNGGKPWSICSGCDPSMKEEKENEENEV